MPAKNGKLEDIIANLLRAGKTYRFICDVLNTSPKRISRVSCSLKSGNQVPLPMPIGRPPKITQQISNFVDSHTLDHPRSSCNELSRLIEEHFCSHVSSGLVRYTRINLHFRYTFPRKRQALTQEQISKRVTFCEKQLQCDPDKWTHHVVITDESRFGIYPDNSMVWLKRGVYSEETFESIEKFTNTFMVWGGIGFNYKSKLIIVDEKLNSEEYIKMLESNEILENIKEKFDQNKVYFQQNAAPAHRAKETINYIKSKILLIDDWPPNSPDLSVIENIWAILKNRLKKLTFNSIEELKQCLIQEWNTLDQTMINNLILTTRNRFRLCLQEKGHSISRFLHRANNYNNEQVPTLHELESLGIIRPKDINESFVGKEVSVSGIVLLQTQILTDPIVYISKIIDHQNHINNEMPHNVGIVFDERFKSTIITGKYHCITGRFIQLLDYCKEKNPNRNESLLRESQTFRYVLEMEHVD